MINNQDIKVKQPGIVIKQVYVTAAPRTITIFQPTLLALLIPNATANRAVTN